jgi:hypothetical protein
MKRIITLLALIMFATVEFTFASVAVPAMNSVPSTPSISVTTPSVTASKEQTAKEWLKEKAHDLSQRQIIAA